MRRRIRIVCEFRPGTIEPGQSFGLETAILAGTLKNLLALRQSEKLGRAERDRVRLAALNALVAHARSNVALYGELYRDVDATPLADLQALQRLPCVTKDDLLAAFPDRLLARGYDEASLYQIATSGTSNRVMIFHDEAKRDWDRAADLIMKYRTEGPGRILTIPPDDCYERCGLNGAQQALSTTLLEAMASNPGIRAGARREVISRAANRLLWNDVVMPAPGVDGSAVSDDKIDDYFDAIARTRPDTVRAYPYFFWLFAQRANGRTFAPCSVVRPTGGKATPAMIDGIERTLGVRYRENYGSAELGTVSMDDGEHRSQLLFDHLFVVEFIRNGQPVPEGEAGEVIITDLRNLACPLIRYRIGDIGRALPRQHDEEQQRFEILGRLDETVVLPSGDFVTPDELTDTMITTPGAAFSRLIQQGEDRFLIEVAPAAEALDEGELVQRVTKLLGPDAKIRVRRVRRIPPEDSGKYRLIRSTSFENFHSAQA